MSVERLVEQQAADPNLWQKIPPHTIGAVLQAQLRALHEAIQVDEELPPQPLPEGEKCERWTIRTCEYPGCDLIEEADSVTHSHGHRTLKSPPYTETPLSEPFEVMRVSGCGGTGKKPLPEAPRAECESCGRRADEEVGTFCEAPDSDGRVCTGQFAAASPDTQDSDRGLLTEAIAAIDGMVLYLNESGHAEEGLTAYPHMKRLADARVALAEKLLAASGSAAEEGKG